MGIKRELNFIALVSIVIGSQIGSGAFILPALLAPFKTIGLFGWVFAVLGAISLALVFSDLSSHLPKNGGPHVYVSEAFGRVAGFFTAWSYWIISWVSNTVLLFTTVSYMYIITGHLSVVETILIEFAIVFIIMIVNIIGVKFSGIIETGLTALKIIPLLIFPIIFFMYFGSSHFNFSGSNLSFDSTTLTTISKTALIIFWGFLGVECATAPAESVKNPKRTIPRAIIIGTSCAALVYILNTISIIGVVGFENLADSKAPYAVVMSKIFSNSSEIAISIIAIVVCIGTLNAWTLTSGQIAYGAFEDKLFPKIFGKLNKAGAPVAALIMAAIGTIPFLIIEQLDCGKDGISYFVNLLVSIFFFIYLACCIAFIVLIKKWKKTRKEKIKAYTISIFSAAFCGILLAQDILLNLVVLGVFIIIGIPIFLKNRDAIQRRIA